MSNMTLSICVLTIIVACGLLTGCLAILPPVFAQQSTESSAITEQSDQRTDERRPLLALGAILFGLCLLGGLRLYQHAQLVNNSQRAQTIRRKLLVRIARLDDDYTLGHIREHIYHSKREHLKQRVLDITLRQYS